MKTTKRVTMTAIAAVGWFALGLQLYLTITNSPDPSLPMATILVRYISYFTILTNLLVAVTLTFALAAGSTTWERFFARATVQTGVAVYIVIVGMIYSLLLRHIWNPTGAQKLADVLLHDIIPVVYGLYWLIFVPKAELRWRHALVWLAYPIAYMIYTLLRGVATGWYPYPFVDVGVLGLPRALGNGGLLLLLFFGLGLAVVAIGRWIGRAFARGQKNDSRIAL
jgi:hypothetical protein